MTTPTAMRLSTSTVEVIWDPPANLQGWGFKWPVRFAISAPEKADGWIVQQVNVRYRTWAKVDGQTQYQYDQITLKDGTPLAKPAETYWEAWPVPANQTAVYWPARDRLAASTRIAVYPDEYLVAPDPDQGELVSRGEVKVVGTVAFYVGELPQSFGVRIEDSAGSLPATKTRPEFWTGVGTPHNLIATWDSVTRGGLLRLNMVPAPPGRFSPPPDMDWNSW